MKRALLLVVVAACGDDEPDAKALRFTQLSDEEIAHVVLASAGTGPVDVARTILALDERAPCPRVEIGFAVTFTGGCTSAAGVRYEGVARRRYEGGRRDHSLIDLDGFEIHDRYSSTVYDGSVELLRGYDDIEANVTVRDLRYALSRTCDEETCEVVGQLELVGRGVATISTSFPQQVVWEGPASILGVERLEISRTRTPWPCLVWQIAGTDRTGTVVCER